MNKTSNKYLIGQRFIFDPYDNSLIDQVENEELTRLGSNESRALSLLIEEPGAIITRTRLHDYVWREQGFEVDDSSLTQAISTLRKALKDSTKSPEFIKTVPKRGYQMIAAVMEVGNCPMPLDEANSQAETGAATSEPNAPEQPEVPTGIHSASGSNNKANTQSKPNSSKTRSSMMWFNALAIIAACLLPLLVNIAFPPKSAAFMPLLRVDGVQVLTPKNHPAILQWKPMISKCVETYLEYHGDEARPVEVIATGGQNNQLWLNYVHGTSMPSENVTLRLLTSHEDNIKLCQ